MILSLAKKHRKNLIAPAIAGGIIYSSEFIGIPSSASVAAPIVSEILVIAFLSWWGNKNLKIREKKANDADKKIKENIENELKYFTQLTQQIPETNSAAKKDADKHISALVKMRMSYSKKECEKLNTNRDNASEHYQKAKDDMLELESDMDSKLEKISSLLENENH